MSPPTLVAGWANNVDETRMYIVQVRAVTVMTLMVMAVTMITRSSCSAAPLDDDTAQQTDVKQSLSSYYHAPQHLSSDTAVRHVVPGRDDFQVNL